MQCKIQYAELKTVLDGSSKRTINVSCTLEVELLTMASQGVTIVHNCLCTGPIILLHIEVKGLSGMVRRRTPLSMHGLF